MNTDVNTLSRKLSSGKWQTLEGKMKTGSDYLSYSL